MLKSSLWFYVAIQILTFTEMAHSAVDVHMDYLWQETDATLQAVIKNNPGKTVILVESDQYGSDSLLRNAATYSRETPHTVVSTGSTTGTSPEARVAKALASVAATGVVPRDPTPILLSGNVVNSGGRTDFHVMNLNPSVQKDSSDGTARDMVIVVHAPESGRQPALLSSYLQLLMPAFGKLKEADESRGGMRVSSFGTAGGVASDHSPGHVDNLRASLFVGVERDPKSGTYSGKISYASFDDKEPVTLYQSPPQTTRAAAEEVVQSAFLKISKNHPLAQEDCGPGNAPLTGEGLNLLNATFRSLILRTPTSLTTSFFGDPELKKAAGGMGFQDVNMEDFHVIRQMQVMKAAGAPLTNVELRRVVADPPVITPSALKDVNSWIRGHQYSQSDYEEALLWGLRGRDFKNAPASASWKPDESQTSSTPSKLTPSLGEGKGGVDPFFFGVAGHLLSSTSQPQFVNRLLDSRTRDDLPKTPEFQKSLSQALATRQQELTSLALQMTKSQNAGDDQLRPLVHTYVDKLRSVPVMNGGQVITVPLLQVQNTSSLRVLNVEPTLSNSDDPSPPVQTAQQSFPTDMNAEKLDRMLYKFSLSNLTPFANDAETSFRENNNRLMKRK